MKEMYAEAGFEVFDSYEVGNLNDPRHYATFIMTCAKPVWVEFNKRGLI